MQLSSECEMLKPLPRNEQAEAAMKVLRAAISVIAIVASLDSAHALTRLDALSVRAFIVAQDQAWEHRDFRRYYSTFEANAVIITVQTIKGAEISRSLHTISGDRHRAERFFAANHANIRETDKIERIDISPDGKKARVRVRELAEVLKNGRRKLLHDNRAGTGASLRADSCARANRIRRALTEPLLAFPCGDYRGNHQARSANVANFRLSMVGAALRTRRGKFRSNPALQIDQWLLEEAGELEGGGCPALQFRAAASHHARPALQWRLASKIDYGP